MRGSTAFLFSLLLIGVPARAADFIGDTIKLKFAGLIDDLVPAWTDRPTASLLSARPIIALRVHQVTDRVTTALVRRSQNQSPKKVKDARKSDVVQAEASANNSERLKADSTLVLKAKPSVSVLQPAPLAVSATTRLLGNCVVSYAPEYSDDAAYFYVGPVYYSPYERSGLGLDFVFGWRPHRHFYPHYQDASGACAESPRSGSTQSYSPAISTNRAPLYHGISYSGSFDNGSRSESGSHSDHFGGNGGLGSGISSGLRGH